MPSFSALASVLGPAVSTAAEGYLEATDALSESNQRRRKAAAEQQLLPLETAVKTQDLQRQLAGGKKIKSIHRDPSTGQWIALYDDNTLGIAPVVGAEPGSPGPVKETAYIKKLKGIVDMMESGSPLQKQLATGEFQRLTRSTDPKELQVWQRWFQMERGEIPFDPALQRYVEGRVRHELRQPAESGIQPTLPAVPLPGQGTSSSTPPPAVQAPQPQAPAVVRPEPTARPTAKTLPNGEPSPAMIDEYAKAYAAMGQEKAKADLAQWVNRDTTYLKGGEPGRITKAHIAGYAKAYPNDPDVSVTDAPTPPPGPEPQFPTTRQRQGAGLPPVAPVPVAPTPPTPAPGTQAPAGGPRPGETVGHYRKDVGLPGFTREQTAAAIALAQKGQLPNAPTVGGQIDLSQLSTADMDKVNKQVADTKSEAGFARVLQRARPYLGQLASLEESKQMLDLVEPLLTEKNVGFAGWINGWVQDVAQRIPMDATLKAGLFNPEIPRLEVLSHAIAIIHANSVKSIAAGGGAQRGVIANDIQEVREWFNPQAWRSSVPKLKAQLKTVHDIIEKGRMPAEKMLRNMGIDPETGGPMKGRRFEHEMDTPAERTGTDILNED